MNKKRYLLAYVLCATILVLGLACSCNVPAIFATAEPQTIIATVTPYMPQDGAQPTLPVLDGSPQPDDGGDDGGAVDQPDPTNTPEPTLAPTPEPTLPPPPPATEAGPLVIQEGLGYEIADWQPLDASREWEGHIRVLFSGGAPPYTFSLGHGEEQSENYLYIRWGWCTGVPTRVDVWSADGQHAHQDIWIESPYCPTPTP